MSSNIIFMNSGHEGKKMQIQLITLTLLLLLNLTGSYAQAAWADKRGKTFPDMQDRKSDNDFAAQIIFTSNAQELPTKWAETADDTTTPITEINKPISAFIVFGGCRTDFSVHCNISMRFRVIQPNGSIYAETPLMEVWHNKPTLPGGSVKASMQYLKLIIEPNKDPGQYTLQAQVRDDNTGTVLFLQKAFTAVQAHTPP